MVKVKLFANFREAAGEKELDLDATTIKELLNTLVKKFQNLEPLMFKDGRLRDYVHIMVNGKHINNLERLETSLKEDDTVAIFPPVSGG
ncbi:molybdopterin synthase sulfur carrier subunit [Archaeoglobales archaeon]|nr:MAG: molybdopterin synthase sulfur carrier subunit [Archaeoglobales archaeon]